MYTIKAFDNQPEHDPYTGGETYTELWINPDTRQIAVTQQYHDNATPIKEWHGVEITLSVPGIEEDELRKFLTDNEDIEAIIKGHTVVWDGNNHVGRLTYKAQQAIEKLQYELDWLGDVCPSEWSVVDVEDWLQDYDYPFDFTALNETGLRKLADEITEDAKLENALIEGVYDYLLEKQKEQIAEADGE